mgnify:CR=1 FL=1
MHAMTHVSGSQHLPGSFREHDHHSEGQTWEAMETYFECITTCSLDDGDCVTQCVEQLREHS